MCDKLSNLLCRGPCDPKPFVAGCLTGNDRDGGLGDLELFCQKFPAAFIRCPVDRRRGQAQFEFSFMDAAKLVAGGPGLDKHP